MDENILMIVIVCIFAAAFAIGFFFIIYKIVGAVMRGSPSSRTQHWTKAQLNTVVTLTGDEQRRMSRKLFFAAILVTVFCAAGILAMASSYWKYVVQGERISATVIAVDSYRSGGRHKRTKYIYTLEAMVNGVRVRDTYRSGSYHAAEAGEGVDVYVARHDPSDLALAVVEERDPLWMLFIVFLLGFFVFGIIKQRKRIASGQMKINQLSKAMRRKKLMELEKPMTPDGKPIYPIRGSSQAPKEGNDGRKYRVS